MPEPVTVSVEVARPRQEVFDYVDLVANHEGWLKHIYKDWRFEGPRRGVGAVAKARFDAPASREQVSFKVTESEAPERIVEEGESAHEKRQTRGTYRFTELEGGRTRIEYEYEWLKTPRSERIAPFISRAFMARTNGKSMKRLAALLEKD
ncbi:MAG TPA: SRPBCC family protein [Solirubrobacterales bacterium]|nr:SRPBCC family protein [Solirubrobacterales bacterium]